MDSAHVISIVVILGLTWLMAIFQLPVIIWTITIGCALLLVSGLGYLSLPVGIIFWTLYLFAAGFANCKQYRLRYLLNPALKILQKRMPIISETEREIIEAGNVWWEKELFCGYPQWDKLFSIPQPTLSQEEQNFIDNQVEQLCHMLNDWQIVYSDKNLTEEVWTFLKKEKFFGMVIPKEYGGLGFSTFAHSTVIMKIASRSVSAAVNTMVPNSLGPGELLLHYGTDEQKNYYLPRLATGEEIPCFALTGPEAGSDAGSIPDTGVVCLGNHAGKKTLGIRLTWDKRYITLAPIATLLGLAIHLYDPEHLLGNKEDIGITLCLIPTSHPGVEIGHRHFPLFLAFLNGPTRGKDVFIPLDWIIGGPSMAGQGWKMLMENLSIGRSISLPALSTACGKLAYRFTGAYARLRRQFNLPISSFEGIQEALGYIAGYTYILEACRIMTAGAVDLKIKPAIASAIAKYQMTELSRKVIAHAMDIHAGQAIQVGPRNLLAALHLGTPICITVEGANILTRNLIIFGQGAIRCHPYLLKEIELITAKEPDINQLDKLLLSHIGFSVSNFIRSVGYGLTGGKFIFTNSKNKHIKKHLKQLTRMSTALALLTDVSLLLLGGNLKRRERLSARLGDILSQLYLASAVLKYFHDNHAPDTDINYVDWAIQNCLYRIQLAIDEIAANFPNIWIGKLMKWIIFPYGKAYHKPNDRLHESIALSMLTPSYFRDRLTNYCYLSNKVDEPSCRLEKALSLTNIIDPILIKLHKAVQDGTISRQRNLKDQIQIAKTKNILSPDEILTLNDFEMLVEQIIKVNEFSFNLDKIIS